MANTNTDLYNDGFSIIGFALGYYDDGDGVKFAPVPKYYYCNISGDFTELSREMALFLTTKLKENIKKGYRLLDCVLGAV